jgi:hypothetical protein
LREAVRRGLGIAILPSFLAEDDLVDGALQELLPGFRPPPMWIKAQIPIQKAAKPSVGALLDFLRSRLLISPGPAGSNPLAPAAETRLTTSAVLEPAAGVAALRRRSK